MNINININIDIYKKLNTEPKITVFLEKIGRKLNIKSLLERVFRNFKDCPLGKLSRIK